MRRSTAAIMVATFLVGCAAQTESTRGDVLTVATVGGYVLVGYAFTLGTTGAFRLDSVYGGSLSCEGKFRYPRPPHGTAYFACSDGQSGSIRIEVDGILTGEGSGNTPMGLMHVVYGYSVSMMNKKLTLPKGTLLLSDDRGIGLVEAEAE